MKKKLTIFLAVAIILIIAIVLFFNFRVEDDPAEIPERPERVFSAWVIYWDQDTAAEEVRMLENLEAISHFSIVFDEYGGMSIPENTLDLHRELRGGLPWEQEPVHFLTLVNDVVFDDGRPSILKCRDVMTLLFETPESRAAHIQDILDLIELHGFDGVELDYETLHRQPGLAEKFALFSYEIWEVLEPMGIPLRILLEPSFPVESIALPEGPCYVVMFYNLYGPGTGPGPKANAAFIRRTANTMRVLPGDVVVAFATGGFKWTQGSNNVTAVTEQMSLDILAESGASVLRDPASGALHFTYIGDDGLLRTVWFADGYTLNFWMDVAQEDGVTHRFALWRLSGNIPESLDMFR